MKLPIQERFYSFQGEGCHAGRAAFFIRTFGCPVHCPWCDSAGTWHPDYVPGKITRIEIEDLVEEALRTSAEFVVITGGEPAIHKLELLTDAFRAVGLQIHLETSGAFPIRGDFDWITLSPKRWRWPLTENLQKADEFKIVVDRIDAVEEYTDFLKANRQRLEESPPIWLHPEWSRHQDPEILNTITDAIKMHGAPFRAGWQLHKYFAADLQDARTAAAVPLGGNAVNGF
ncbi:MAG: 7-carboxy-7-deazaguanine synthase QueE [Verrucomicrobiota bacterium]